MCIHNSFGTFLFIYKACICRLNTCSSMLTHIQEKARPLADIRRSRAFTLPPLHSVHRRHRCALCNQFSWPSVAVWRSSARLASPGTGAVQWWRGERPRAVKGRPPAASRQRALRAGVGPSGNRHEEAAGATARGASAAAVCFHQRYVCTLNAMLHLLTGHNVFTL